MRIIFMGTPAFAVPTLLKLHESGFSIAAVVTATDKLGGRGKKELIQSPVKLTAKELQISVLQPISLKNESFLHDIRQLRAELFVVVAFRMLPEVLWAIPPMGTINLHASLLPDYRGAAPINWVLIHGEPLTGATTFFIRSDIDTGPIIKSVSIPIAPDDTAGVLHDKLMLIGADLVIDSINEIRKPNFISIPQPRLSGKIAPKLNRDLGKIEVTNSTMEIINLIRGLSPYPGAWIPTKMGDVKIFTAAPGLENNLNFAGKHLLSDDKSYIYLKTADGYISLEYFQLPGNKPMRVQDYLNGNKANNWF
jgi:methionyl-tRNA formyltransferase